MSVRCLAIRDSRVATLGQRVLDSVDGGLDGDSLFFVAAYEYRDGGLDEQDPGSRSGFLPEGGVFGDVFASGT